MVERRGDESTGAAVPAVGAAEDQVGAVAVPAAVRTSLDLPRLRSLVGFTLALIGPRANLAVSGVLLTLVVSHRASGAVAVTFALTANRVLGWLAYPLLGRASDRTRSAAGRRAPYMAAGLVVMGVCTWSYTAVGGYWPLVALIMAAKTASVTFGLSNVAAVPETFGKSRALRATVLIAILGTLVSVVIKFTVIATWKQQDPRTWALAFQMAGGFMVVVGVAVALLVRQAPVVAELAERDRHRHRTGLIGELRELRRVPNAAVLAASVLLLWFGLNATGYLVIVYFQKVQHAGAAYQTIAGWVTGVPGLVIGVPLGLLAARLLTVRQVAILAPLGWSVLTVIQFFTTHLWQSVVLAVAATPLLGAFAASLAPMLVQLLPREGGMGELLGKLVAPFSAVAIVASFASAWAVDASGSYRVIWLFPAACGLVQAGCMVFLRVPRGHERPRYHGKLESLVEGISAQVLDRRHRLLAGEVTLADADATSWFPAVREFLGDPYAEDDPDDPDEPSAFDGSEGLAGPEGPEVGAPDAGRDPDAPI